MKNITKKSVHVNYTSGSIGAVEDGSKVVDIVNSNQYFRKNGRVETGSAVGNSLIDEVYNKIEIGQLIIGSDGQLIESRATGRAEYVAVEAILIPLPPLLKAFQSMRGSVAVAESSIAKVGGDAFLTEGEILRIENAATRINKPIDVVGSRASGTARAGSDWDYVIQNMTNREWKKIKNSLPGSASKLDNVPRQIDVFKKLDPTRPHITITPR